MQNEKKDCKPGIRDTGFIYTKADDTYFPIDGAYNYVVENLSANKVMLDLSINLEPLHAEKSVRVFFGNNRDRYTGNVKISWLDSAPDTDSILVILTHGGTE